MSTATGYILTDTDLKNSCLEMNMPVILGIYGPILSSCDSSLSTVKNDLLQRHGITPKLLN